MENMSLEQIASACGGTYYGDKDNYHLGISGVAIDSRKIKTDYLFVPLRGARVDGHKFIPQVMGKGALCTLSEKLLEGLPYPYILVNSCEQALKDIAEYYRSTLDVKVIGITGSVGKTSTKEMIASVLEQKYCVLKTEGNYNNEIGLPLTIFNIEKQHNVAVLEMGISNFGEMHRLSKIARPDVCVITNIGYSHIEYLKSQAGILKAKTEMFDYMKPGAAVILNGDDEMLAGVGKKKGSVPGFFGLDQKHDIYADNICNLGLKGTTCTIHLPDSSITPLISIPGAHMVYNALAGAAVGSLLGLSGDQIKAGIEYLKPVAGRNHIIEAKGLTIIDDCYNANPVSMKASIEILSYALNRKIAVLGDMGELGSEERTLHNEIGAYAVQTGIDCIYCIGELSKEYVSGAKAELEKNNKSSNCTILHFDTKEAFLKEAFELICKEDTILVKASHSMDFPVIVNALQQ